MNFDAVPAAGVGMSWSAAKKLATPDAVLAVNIVALYVAGGALVANA